MRQDKTLFTTESLGNEFFVDESPAATQILKSRRLTAVKDKENKNRRGKK